MPQIKKKLTTAVKVPDAGMFRNQNPDEDDATYAFLKKKHQERFAKDTAGHRDARARAVEKIGSRGY